uniref:BPTI/Kunitz inhibitor domain-containing protein n=1 Tax=Syphacia muris TaxID=451379 RepID=A0A0N5AHR1_9BILA
MIKIVAVAFCCFCASVSAESCTTDPDCDKLWPRATCRNGRCICPENTIRRKSESYGWVCVSLFDASTGMIGSPFTCPLPEGGGHLVAQVKDGQTLCNPKKKDSCPKNYECIITVGQISGQSNTGVCCPRRENSAKDLLLEETCRQKPSISPEGWIVRWYFNGAQCKQFNWNPEKNSTSANNFTTKKHCESYCKFA